MSILNKEKNKEIKESYLIYCKTLKMDDINYCIHLSKNNIFIQLRSVLNLLCSNDTNNDICVNNFEVELHTTKNIYNWGNNVLQFLKNKLLCV